MEPVILFQLIVLVALVYELFLVFKRLANL